MYIVLPIATLGNRRQLLTTKLPMTTVAKKKGMQTLEATNIQSHIDSIHSPHKTRKTIMKLCMKSTKFQRGISLDGKRSVLSETECRKYLTTTVATYV